MGTAYMALFNLAFARKHGGKMILRIEDTDQARSTQKSEDAILDALKWLGLEWDEGPDSGGEYGPYRQSERLEMHQAAVQRLLELGHAYRCFCTPERLDALRKEQIANKETPRYDGHCLSLSEEEIQEKMDRGEPYVIRMKVPAEGECVFLDELRGEVRIEWKQIDHQIIQKSDGFPTYHLANVVDDHLMQISHVIRGEEWINSAPKHILLYQYFGWDIPVFCHLPLLRNVDKSKLSKRKNPTSILYYQRMGYLPEALLNYLGRMGWSMPDEREKFTLDDMLKEFDIQRVSLGGPIFDVEKLSWLNGMWIREELTDEQLADRLQQWALNRDTLMAFLPFAKQRMETLSDIAPLGSYLVSGMLPISEEDLRSTGMEDDQLMEVLQFSLWRLESIQQWQRDNIFDALKSIADAMDIKMKPFLAPLFIAIAGSSSSISVMDSMALLGADMSRARLRHAIDLLGGVGKKKLKKMEKAYQQLG